MPGFLARVLLCAGFALAAGSASAQTKLSYGSYLPPTHVNNTVGIEPMIKRMGKESGGKLTVESFPGGSVAKATAAVDSIRDGIVTAGMVVDTYVPKQLPHSFLVTELALLGRNSVVMSGASNEFNLVLQVSRRPEEERDHLDGVLLRRRTDVRNQICDRSPISRAKNRSAGLLDHVQIVRHGAVNVTSDGPTGMRAVRSTAPWARTPG
jgi:hypothetical protein